MITIIEKTTKKYKRLSEKELLAVASEVTEIFVPLAIHLGSSQAEIEGLRETYHGSGIENAVFGMLVKWQHAQPNTTDFRKTLADALHHCKRIDLEEKLLQESLLEEVTNDGDTLHVGQCQEDLRWVYLNSICRLQKYPWDDSDCIDISDIYTELSLLVDSPGPCQPMKIPLKTQDEIFIHRTVAECSSTRIIIQGEAGTGKSTLLAKYAYDWAKQEDKKTDSPLRKYKLLFLLRMRDLKESTNLEDAIVKYLLPQDTKVTVAQLKTFLEDHSEDCCIILDGYDEFKHSGTVASSTGSVFQILHNNILRGCLLILSSRPTKLSYLSTSLKQYRKFEVNGFSTEKIHEFIKKFFGEKTDSAEKLIDFIKSNNLDSSFAAAPLVTQLLCLYWMKLEETEGSKTPESLNSICKLHDALFDYLEEHYIAKHGEQDSIDLDEIIRSLGKVAFESLWPPNSQLVFTCEDFRKDISDHILNQACAIGLLRKQEASQGAKHKGRRRSSLSSWKKSTTIEYFHKSAQEKCAAEYLVHLAETNESLFSSKMEVLKSPNDALDAKMILIFASGQNVDVAAMIVKKLTNILKRLYQAELDEYLTGSLHYEKSKTIQDMIDLCLTCNFESAADGKINEDLLSIFPDGQILHTGIVSQRAQNLAYFLSNLKDSNAITSMSIFGVPGEGSFFIPTETKESTSDRTFHDYLEVYSNLPEEEQQQKLAECIKKCPKAKDVSDHNGIPCTLASMHMWQLFEEWQKETQTSMSILISSLKSVNIHTLVLRSMNLGKSCSLLWHIITEKHLQNLTLLNLRQTGLTANDVKAFANCIHCLTKLEDLDICQNKTSGESLGVLCKRLSSVQLKSLDIYRMLASPSVMQKVHLHLPGLGPQLERLYLHVNNMDEEGTDVLAESINTLPNLTLLTLPNPNQGSSTAIYKLFRNMSGLKHLRSVSVGLGNIELGTFFDALIPELKTWKNVEILRLFAQECIKVNTNHGKLILEAISCLNSLCTLKLMRIGMMSRQFDQLVRFGKEKPLKALWYCRSALPDDHHTYIGEEYTFITIL